MTAPEAVPEDSAEGREQDDPWFDYCPTCRGRYSDPAHAQDQGCDEVIEGRGQPDRAEPCPTCPHFWQVHDKTGVGYEPCPCCDASRARTREEIERAILARLEARSSHEYLWPRWAAAEEAAAAVMELLAEATS